MRSCPVPSVSRCPGGGRVLQHHPADQTDQGEDRGEGLQSHAGIQQTPSRRGFAGIRRFLVALVICTVLLVWEVVRVQCLAGVLLFGSDFTLLCSSKESAAPHRLSPFLAQDGCTHAYIISRRPPKHAPTFPAFYCTSMEPLLMFAPGQICYKDINKKKIIKSAGLVAQYIFFL